MMIETEDQNRVTDSMARGCIGGLKLFAAVVITIALVIFFASCSFSGPPKEPVHRKPFYVNKKGGSFEKDFCQYMLIEISTGDNFWITERCDQYSVGDTIR